MVDIPECMCQPAGNNNTIWPATKCGDTRVISCYEGAPDEIIMRKCTAQGQWEDYAQGNCTCSAITEYGTLWPKTDAGEIAHVACVKDGMSRDRMCLPNGEWDDIVTGGCSCQEETYLGVQWYETDGGQEAQHICDLGAEGSGYRRMCNVDGTWSLTVEGECSCPEVEASGIVWEAASALHTQVEQCSPDAEGTQMSRTCSQYGSWEPIQGNCDCPEVLVDDILWPQTTSGYTAMVACATGAVGTPSTRVCNPRGTWGEVIEGVCSCPSEDWSNYAGTHYLFPEIMEGEVVTMPCVKEPEMNITRVCGRFGAWEQPEGCFEAVYCPAETQGQLTFEETLGGSTWVQECNGTSNMFYGRVCQENGQWEDVVGYCQCEAHVDAIGNAWPRLRSEETIELTCASGYTGLVSRGCSFLGEWYDISNTCIRNVCPEETLQGITWPSTDSLSTVTQECNNGLTSMTRTCSAEGEWEAVEGSCLCPATVMDEVTLPESPLGYSVSLPCSEDYMGSLRYECSGLGTWTIVDECERISCPAETYQGVDWPVTEGGETSVVNCTSSAIGSNTRYCRPTGEWSSVVEGSGCYCDQTTVNENGFYVFAKTAPDTTVTKSCSAQYTGSISYHCSRSGTWTDLNNQCERIQCPGELLGGLFFAATDSNSTRHLACEEGALGNGYDRFCGITGQWEEEIVGECKCPAETVRHVDGHLYSFQETEGGVVTSQVCGGDLAGSVSRVCSLLGGWQPIRGECKRLECPEERLGNYVWPATNSSTEVRLPCTEYQTGYVSRTCHAAGIWGDPVDNCTEQRCDPLSVNRLGNGCMNIMFDTTETKPYVRVNVVPSNSPDLSIIFRGRTVRICGLEANVAYSMFVQYCEDEQLTACTNSCMMDNVYYQQVCEVMQPIDVTDVEKGTEFTTLSFSSKFPECPDEAYSLEIAYQCVEGCVDNTEYVRTTLCSSVGGCKAGDRLTVRIEDEFPDNALFQVRQRMRLNSEFSELQPYSDYRSFRVRDLLRASEVTPTVEFLNSHKVRLHLGDVTSGAIVYSKHTIYIYKKLAGTRRLVDSLFSTVTLCPLGNTVCEETYTDVVVEPGYDYSFSVYSYPIISGGKVIVSTASITVDLVPPFTMSVVPGDYFISVTLAGAKYPLSGYCSFVAQNALSTAQQLVSVTLPGEETLVLTGSDLVIDSPYTVSCLLRDEMGLENRITMQTHTLPVMTPTLELIHTSDTTYDVQVAAYVNKPCSLYCTVSEANREWTKSELVMYGTKFTVTSSHEPFTVNLLLSEMYQEMYRVSCVAVDLFNRDALKSILVTPSGTPYAPVLVSTVPENNAVDVAARVNMELVFKYPVLVSTCQFCFFILYDMKKHISTNLYASSYVIQSNRIIFNAVELSSETTYLLKASTRGLIYDAANGVVYDPLSDVLITFQSKKFSPVGGEVVDPDDLVPVNGVLEILYNNYLFLNEGSITINSLSIDASNKCLQIVRPSESSTLLRIPFSECLGLLRPDSSYVVVLPEGLLRSRENVMSPRLTHVFQTSTKSFAPHVIGSYPEHLDSYVPLDAPLRLYFDQPVTFGSGFVFISEYLGGEYVNSYNLPGSKAVFSQSFPYEVSWEGYLFTLKPYHTYVISWSEGVVRNAYDEPVAASTAAETIEFESAKSACSADFLAENSHGVFQCTYENDQCVCTQWNLIAMTH